MGGGGMPALPGSVESCLESQVDVTLPPHPPRKRKTQKNKITFGPRALNIAWLALLSS